MKMTGVYHTEQRLKTALRAQIKRRLKPLLAETSARQVERMTGIGRDSIGDLDGCSVGQLVRIALALDIRISIDNGKGTK